MDNIEYIKNDKIDRKELVDKVYDIVNSLKENKNICLAINGEWGSGKSYVMGMLDEKFINSDRYLVIKYDAWKNNFYNDPLIAILTCIYDAIEDKIKHIEQLQEKQIKEISKSAANTVSKLIPFLEVLKTAIEGIKDVLEKYHNPINTERLEDFKSYRNLLQDTKDILNNLTISYAKGLRQKRLVILVDEIDRCLPNEQLKILERLHHLFDVNNCAVIVAINEQSVSKTINTLYGVDGYEYLRKFFDITYKLGIGSEKYIKSLLNDIKTYIYKQIGKEEPNLDAIDYAYQYMKCGSKKVLSKIDNREVKRYCENLLCIINEYGIKNLTYSKLIFIIVALFIRKNIDETFLNEDIVLLKQKKFNEEITQNREKYVDVMHFYDYFNEYLGVDRNNYNIDYGINNKQIEDKIPYYSWAFSEMVNLTSEFPLRTRDSILYHEDLDKEECIKLKNLVIKYAGEQNRND